MPHRSSIMQALSNYVEVEEADDIEVRRWLCCMLCASPAGWWTCKPFCAGLLFGHASPGHQLTDTKV
jgi:hypothetical protein